MKKLSTQVYVIKNPKAPRSFAQVKCIFAIGKALHYSEEKITALQKKAVTKGQASAMIKQLQKVQSRS